MLNLPKECVIFDTEFTAWEGAMERGWNEPGEYREIVQIGAILIDTETFEEKDHLLIYVKPIKNPQLSDYFIKLTGITQNEVDEKGVSLDEALEELHNFAHDHDLYSFGSDEEVVEENCNLLNISFPFDIKKFHDIRDTFKSHGISTEGYMSSTIVQAFGEESKHTGHDGLNDTRTILDALRLLAKSI